MKNFILTFMLVAFAFAAFSGAASAQDANVTIAADEAVLLFLKNDVKVKNADSDVWVTAEEDMMLSGGSSLRAGGDSWAEVGFGDEFKNVVRIKEHTLLELTQVSPARVNLLRGELRSLVQSLDRDSTFEVRTPTAVCGARGTAWDTATDGKKVMVDTYEDKVFFGKLSPDGKSSGEKDVIGGKRGLLEDPAGPINLSDIPAYRIWDYFGWKGDFMERLANKGPIKGALNKVGKSHRTVKDVMTAKDKILGDKDRDSMDKRLEDRSEHHEEPPKYREE